MSRDPSEMRPDWTGSIGKHYGAYVMMRIVEPILEGDAPGAEPLNLREQQKIGLDP